MNINTSFFSLKSGSPFMIAISLILGTLLMAYGIYEIAFKKDKKEIKGTYHGYKKVNNLYCRPIFLYAYGTKKYNQASIQEFKVEKIEKKYVKGNQYPIYLGDQPSTFYLKKKSGWSNYLLIVAGIFFYVSAILGYLGF